MRKINRLTLNWLNRDGKLIIVSRGTCTFAQSFIAILLALYMDRLGFSLTQIGACLSAGIAGSAFVNSLLSFTAEKLGRRRILIIFTLLSAISGLALVFANTFLPVMFIIFLGSITGRGGLGAMTPLEQAILADAAPPEKRTDLFAIYRITIRTSTAIGALAAGLPALMQSALAIDDITSYKIMFIIFALFHLLGALVYAFLSHGIEVHAEKRRWTNPIRLPSRRIIFTLTGLFSLDYLASAFILESLVAYWFSTRFGLELQSLAIVFFLSHVLSALSLWLSAKLANRIGLINVMVFTHIPANIFLIVAAFAPTAILAVMFWQLRAFLSMMDSPARDAYTMSIVEPHERIAMAGINGVGRSFSGAAGPSVATALWQAFTASTPLISCGVLKIVYDVFLYIMFRNLKTPQEIKRTIVPE